jgi:hypothetical protein
MHKGEGEMDDPKRSGEGLEGKDPENTRWVPVAIAFLAVASVAAEIWGVLRGLSLIIAR